MKLALTVWRTFFSLALIIGLIYFVMYVLRRTTGEGGSYLASKKMFAILGRFSLGPKKSIYLVRVGEKILVLGVGNEINLLLVIEDGQLIKSIEYESKNPLKIREFSDYLKKALSFKLRPMGKLWQEESQGQGEKL